MPASPRSRRAGKTRSAAPRPADFLFIQPRESSGEMQVFAHGKVFEQGQVLEDDSQGSAPFPHPSEDGAAFPQDAAAAGVEEPREHRDRGQLPGPVGTEKPEDPAAGNGKRQLPDGRVASIAFRKGLQLDELLVHPAMVALCLPPVNRDAARAMGWQRRYSRPPIVIG